MNVKTSVKSICESSKVIRPTGRAIVICQNPKHTQLQG